jgi:hypothetical protein
VKVRRRGRRENPREKSYRRRQVRVNFDWQYQADHRAEQG